LIDVNFQINPRKCFIEGIATMAPLLNPRHEKAARLRAEGALIVDAHEQAYGKRSKQAASTLFKRTDVANRVVELQNQRIQIEVDTTEAALKQLGITKKWWLGSLKTNAERCLLGKPVLDRKGVAHSIPDVHGFNKSMELIGRAMGLFIEKVEIGNSSGQSFAVSGNLAPVNFGSSGFGGNWINSLNNAATSAPVGTNSTFGAGASQNVQPSQVTGIMVIRAG
jgi:hypothetical protein